ncbi:MAG: asparaginase [Candidatus Saccharicenans sp.]|nr:asparaginase [Candidatus Saccharicenans sp.]MDI6849926.1 asparaginase [Candidatus Saccharicenans sp.]
MNGRRKILVLFCGGTIVMEEKSDGSLAVPDSEESAIKILREVEPRLSAVADYDIEFIANIDSTNIAPADWDRILLCLKENYRRYDGFVIIHGTDTMAYTAAALSVSIKGLGKPIVLTGSQIPAIKIESDARRNLVNAFRVATMPYSGVFIVFDRRIISGSRATKASESSLDAFRSVNGDEAGEITVDIRMKSWVKTRKPEPHDIEIASGFEADIFIHTLSPGCDPGDLEFLLNRGNIKGIIIRAYGTGNIPYGFENFFRKARSRNLPVIITSQCLYGKTLMNMYEVGRRALAMGVIEGGAQSLEILCAKLMWALRHAPGEIEKIVREEIQ